MHKVYGYVACKLQIYVPFFHIENSQDTNLILIAHTDISIFSDSPNILSRFRPFHSHWMRTDVCLLRKFEWKYTFSNVIVYDLT